jgi:hypothetical protein
MARKRISMRKIKEVLRLKLEVGLTYEAIGQSRNIGSTTVGEYLRRAKDAGLTWPLPEDMDDASLERLLYPGSPGMAVKRPVPDWEYVHKELKRKSVTLYHSLLVFSFFTFSLIYSIGCWIILPSL